MNRLRSLFDADGKTLKGGEALTKGLPTVAVFEWRKLVEELAIQRKLLNEEHVSIEGKEWEAKAQHDTRISIGSVNIRWMEATQKSYSRQ